MKQISKIAAIAFSAMSLAACDFLDFDQSTGYDNQQEVYEAWARAEQSLTNVYSYLDGDIARLIRLHQTLDVDPKDVVVLCFPHQIAFLRGYLGRRVEIRVIDMDTVEEELGPERRNLFER